MRLPMAFWAAVAAFAGVASCTLSAPAGQIGSPARHGIQVWNHTDTPRTLTVQTRHANGTRRLVATMVVPASRPVRDASLGGDPGAVLNRSFELRDGEDLVVVGDDRGLATTQAFMPQSGGWAIVFVGQTSLEVLIDSGPRGLD